MRSTALVAFLAIGSAGALSAAPALSGVQLRVVAPADLPRVAALQLDVFVPPPEAPALLPMLAQIFEANQRATRVGMRERLTAELETRLSKGSEMFLVETDAAEPATGLVEGGTYVEPGLPLLGTVDLSIQEMQLPTHGIAEGLYLSHMAVETSARRRGHGRRLLAAASESAASRGALGIYLHVERSNEAAIALYEQEGYVRQPESPMYVAFTRALNLEHREPLLFHKRLAEPE